MERDIRLGVLDQVSVASPCPANWDDMTGDDTRRFCPDCRMNVYNLSAMSRAEAEALVLGAEGRLCARFYRRADGTLLTRDCPVGLRAARERVARMVRAAAALVGLVALGAAAAPAPRFGARLREIQPFAALCRWLAPAAPPPPPRMLMGDVVMGKMSAPPSPAPPAQPNAALMGEIVSHPVSSPENAACSGTSPAPR